MRGLVGAYITEGLEEILEEMQQQQQHWSSSSFSHQYYYPRIGVAPRIIFRVVLTIVASTRRRIVSYPQP